VVDSVDALCVVAASSAAADRTKPTVLSEGFYLALVSADLSAEQSKDTRLLRAEVTDILDAGRVRFCISSTAATRVKAKEQVVLLRPRGSTTMQMKAIPLVADVVDDAVPEFTGMSASEGLKLALSSGRIKQLGLAILSYEARVGRFPPAIVHGPDGKPWHSWRVLILPFLDEQKLFKQYRLDEPWDSPNNKQLIEKMPDVFHDPVYGDSKDHFTNYAAVSGQATIFPVENARFDGTANDLLANLSKFGVSIGQISDGTSKTLLLGPVGPERKIPWTKPEDVVCTDKLPPLGQLGSFAMPFKVGHGTAGVFAFADDHVLAIRSEMKMDDFLKLTTRAGDELVPADSIPSVSSPNEHGRTVLIINYRETGATATLKLEPRPRVLRPH
jgi:hypothetical protein